MQPLEVISRPSLCSACRRTRGVLILTVLGRRITVAATCLGRFKKSVDALTRLRMVPTGEVGLIFASGKAMGVVSPKIFSAMVVMVISRRSSRPCF